ncbi:hypothetical protein DQ04_00731110 [Trypanosoma grayi]|uniref:hypothetical protein n=1 Tax=Trypanosoma grayi TaxID=71804 RepID=UPI0004F4B5DC|nr:hypothetical protein DQ04_00731110 [Trypanosoma grayi]KEG13889.1 hypothetical protein DQ04_00731110 [Trypanosoma grayi]
MPSCERMPLHRFHSRESRLYSENCVRELTHGKQFQAYTTHVEYNEHLQLSWFIAPIGIMIAFYYHLLFLFHDTYSALADGAVVTAPCFFTTTLLLVFFVAPCVVIAPFAGFFELISRRRALSLLGFFTCINIAVVSFGGKWLHHPPYLISDPPVPLHTSKVSAAWPLVKVVLVRALPLQGAIVAGWLVHVWRSMRWDCSWRVPLPLLTIPAFIGAFACFWFRAVSLLTASVLLEEELDVTGAVAGVVAVMRRDVLDMVTGRTFPTAFTDAGERYQVWCTALALAVLYFVGMLLPAACGAAGGIRWLLPTHPTTWGLTLTACLAGLSAVTLGDHGSVAHLLGLLVVVGMLLYNGVALPL